MSPPYQNIAGTTGRIKSLFAL